LQEFVNKFLITYYCKIVTGFRWRCGPVFDRCCN